jgi:hypothetical protein
VPLSDASGDAERSASTERQAPLLGPESKLRRNPQVVARDLAEGQGGVLLHLESGQYHGINAVGLAIWELIGDGCTVADVVQGLRERVQDPPSTLESDVMRFLEGIHQRDLVVVEP